MKLTEVETQITASIQKHITLNEDVKLAELADECHVAQSTIIKLSKKLGYSGFLEMYYQLRHQHQAKSDVPFRKKIVTGDLDQQVCRLAEKLYEFRHAKNLIFSLGKNDFCGNYFSRKIAMFDIFAPSTYDYLMAEGTHIPHGLAFFLNGRTFDNEEVQIMYNLVVRQGYTTVVFTDELHQEMGKKADIQIILQAYDYKKTDMFNAKILILIELMLSEYARLYRKENAHEC